MVKLTSASRSVSSAEKMCLNQREQEHVFKQKHLLRTFSRARSLRAKCIVQVAPFGCFSAVRNPRVLAFEYSLQVSYASQLLLVYPRLAVAIRLPRLKTQACLSTLDTIDGPLHISRALCARGRFYFKFRWFQENNLIYTSRRKITSNRWLTKGTMSWSVRWVTKGTMSWSVLLIIVNNIIITLL